MFAFREPGIQEVLSKCTIAGCWLKACRIALMSMCFRLFADLCSSLTFRVCLRNKHIGARCQSETQLHCPHSARDLKKKKSFWWCWRTPPVNLHNSPYYSHILNYLWEPLDHPVWVSNKYVLAAHKGSVSNSPIAYFQYSMFFLFWAVFMFCWFTYLPCYLLIWFPLSKIHFSANVAVCIK